MTSDHPVGDCAKVSVHVAVPVDAAFALFTDEIDLWWKQGPRYRIAGRRRGQLTFEAGARGRLFETFETAQGPRTFEVGRVTTWEPPRVIAFEWRGVNYAADEKTFVEIRFEDARGGTVVTVRHWGFAALRDDHPVRHGLTGAAFIRMVGLWWGDLAASLREQAARRA